MFSSTLDNDMKGRSKSNWKQDKLMMTTSMKKTMRTEEEEEEEEEEDYPSYFYSPSTFF